MKVSRSDSPLSKPQYRVLTAMQMRGADLKHNRVEIGAMYSTLYALEKYGIVKHDYADPETWWLTEHGKKWDWSKIAAKHGAR